MGRYLLGDFAFAFGVWRSLVAHVVRDDGVGGSNPLIPTKYKRVCTGYMLYTLYRRHGLHFYQEGVLSWLNPSHVFIKES